MTRSAPKRLVAVLAALVIAGMAIGAAYHHHGTLVLDAGAGGASLVGVSDEGPSACGLCVGTPGTVASFLAPLPAPAPVLPVLRLSSVPVDEIVVPASGTPRSPPVPTAFAV